ncbi:MAG: hypothetical protein NT155_03730 [Candidatus Staskawiczbacteria bacterium]|nr:hypothetical protein [Candidatus Staskawiczbacteria bacterium]
MPETLATSQVRDLSNGVIQGVDDRLAPKNSVSFALNLRFDKILGRAVLREGTAIVGAQITDAKNILGLHQFILSSGTKHLLSVIDGASNSALYRLITATWTSESVSGVKTVKHRFLTYLDTCMVLDGTNATSSADGDTWVTTGGNLDIGNCPKGKFAVVWHDQVFVAGVSSYLDRLFYSSTPTAGAIAWTGDESGHLDIEPYHGQGDITALSKVPNYLLIFKDRALKRWDGSSTFPDDLCNIGTPSHESVVLGNKTVLYFSASYKESLGIYETDGNTTRKISRPIQDIIEAIDSANYTSIAGFSNAEIAMWSVGDMTYDGKSYSNVVILYNISSQNWTCLGFPTKFTVFTPYIDSTTLKIIAGNNDGEVIELFVGVNDNITGNSDIGIQYALQYPVIDFGARGNTKEVSSVVPYTKNGKDTQVLCRINEKNNFKPVGVVDDDFESEMSKVLKGHTFEFKLTGEKKGGGLQIIGLDIIYPEMEETIKK